MNVCIYSRKPFIANRMQPEESLLGICERLAVPIATLEHHTMRILSNVDIVCRTDPSLISTETPSSGP
jgi:hypothetical protein